MSPDTIDCESNESNKFKVGELIVFAWVGHS